MSILLWCAGIYLAVALIVGGFAAFLSITQGEPLTLWQYIKLAVAWPIWLIGILGSVLYNRYR